MNAEYSFTYTGVQILFKEGTEGEFTHTSCYIIEYKRGIVWYIFAISLIIQREWCGASKRQKETWGKLQFWLC